MSHIWSQTISIDQDLAKKIIEEQTSLIVSSIEIFGQGFDNIAYLINKEMVFRFPRREMGLECMHNEILILPYLANRVSFPFSSPQFIGKPSKLYQAPFAGYNLLRGKLLSDMNPELITDKNVAKTLALWLKELHSVPILENHERAMKGDQTWRLNVKDKLFKTKKRIEIYESYFVDAGFKKIELLLAVDALSVLDFSHIENICYVHGDLYSRHILMNDSFNLCGIIDWGDIHIGHPGTDLSIGCMIFADDALKIFYETYGDVNKESKDIALLRAFCHSIVLMAYCYEQKEENLKKWTIFALRNALEKIGTLKPL